MELRPVAREQKTMPRRPRVFVEGLVHHTDCCVGRGETSFRLDGEAERFRALLHEVR